MLTPTHTGRVQDSRSWDFHGCYALFSDSDCLYVGATWRPTGLRIATTIIRLGVHPVTVQGWELSSDIFALQRQLIDHLHPVLNVKRPALITPALYRGLPCLIVGREGSGRSRIEFTDGPKLQKTVLNHELKFK